MTKQMLNDWLSLNSKIPSGSEVDNYRKWLLYEDILSFFIKKKLNDEIMIYASTSLPSSALLNSFFAPKPEIDSISDPLIQEILARNFYPYEPWMVNYTIPNTKNADIKDYNFSLEEDSSVCSDKSKSISKYEGILFRRSFEGKHSQKQYIEISQKILHSQGLHYVHERKAFCKFDDLGEIVECITVHYEDEEVIAVIAKRDILDQFMAVTNMSLIRIFNITRTPINFQGFGNEREPILIRDEENKIFCDGAHTLTASCLRGFQIIDCKESRERVLRNIISFSTGEDKEHVEFLAHDWKNNLVSELSCDPQKLGNYFVKSKLPYETSPAFFRKEILLKYQNDPDKYVIDYRSIYCRGAWRLRSYDINEEGQVHAYLIDLAQLPHQEQLYWKAYNEKPKGTISKRAFINDFEGEICYDYDPFYNLKSQLKVMYTEQLGWWHNKDIKLIDEMHFLATSSTKEWKDSITNLNILLVDNLKRNYLLKLAEELGVVVSVKDSSLKILREYLIKKEHKKDLVESIMFPLFELNHLRSNISSHSQSRGKELTTKVIADHGSREEHFKYLIKSCDQSIRELREILK